jgi:hypothetical protein
MDTDFLAEATDETLNDLSRSTPYGPDDVMVSWEPGGDEVLVVGHLSGRRLIVPRTPRESYSNRFDAALQWVKGPHVRPE